MSHRALVIGVDDYAGQPGLRLQGSVHDAIAFTKWLIDPTGGAVLPSNVSLLTSPAPSPPPPELLGVEFVSPATAQNIIQQLLDLPNKFAEPGDRLYFYFSGHGLTAPNDIAQEAILPADFAFLNTGAAIGVRAIQDWFKTSYFDQQFLFVDACRNAMLARRFSVPTFAIPDPTKMRPNVEQFVYMATSRGLSAGEAQLIRNTRAGVFTTALIDGLRGAGAAKLYNVSAKTYDVTSNSLVPYLTDIVRKQIAALTVPNGADPTAFLQTPTLTGERFSDPTICSFPRTSFKPVMLAVDLCPGAVRDVSTIVVERDDIQVHVASPVPNVPYHIPLPPKEYSVTVTANNYIPSPLAFPIKLYDDASLQFSMTPIPAPISSTAAAVVAPALVPASPLPQLAVAAAAPNALSSAYASATPQATIAGTIGGQVSAAIFTTSGTASTELDVSTASAPSSFGDAITVTITPNSLRKSDTGVLIVETADDSSTLEIERSGNENLNRDRAVVVTGQQHIKATLPPDLYAARLWAPNGRNVEKLVRLQAGTTESVWLEPPAIAESDPLLELAKQAGFSAGTGVLQISETSGLSPLAWVRLSTILSMASIAQVFPRSALIANRLRSLGLTTLAALSGNSTSAIQIVVGDEIRFKDFSRPAQYSALAPERAEIDSVSVACLPLDARYIETQHLLSVLTQYTFIGEQSIALQPGAYWLCIRDRNSAGTFLPISISPNRVTTVVFTRNGRGRVSIFIYQPSPTADNPKETMRLERRFEMAQRYVMSGQLGDAERLFPIRDNGNVEEFLPWNQYDPIHGLLGAYLSLRAFEAQQTSNGYSVPKPALSKPLPRTTLANSTMRLVDDLAEHFSFIPDVHVLKAEVERATGDLDAANTSVRDAFDAGLPMFDEGALRLAKLAAALCIEHARSALLRKVLEKRIPGMLWTVCALGTPPQPEGPLLAPASWPDPLVSRQ